MPDLKQKLINFLNGYWYPVYIAFFVLIGHIYSFENYSIIFIMVTVCAGFILCKDLKFFISPLLCFYFIFSKQSLTSETFYSTSSLIFYVLIIIAILISISIHFILYRKELKIKNFSSSFLFKGFILLTVLFLVNGISNIQNYNASNFIFGFLIVISFVLPFFLFSINLNIDKHTRDYLLCILLITSLVIMIELLNLYLNKNIVINGVIHKSLIDLGWGVSNNIGAILTMLMPVYFYCAGHTKYTMPFFWGGIITYVFVLLSLSRTSILFATPILILCIIFLCVYKHKHRRQVRLYTLILTTGVIFVCIFLRETINTAFDEIIRVGLDDSGRFEYYKDGLEKFFNHPLFGAGFGNSHGTNDKFIISAPEYFHNTIVQILASCGIIGFGAYVYHRWQTVKLFLNTRNPYSFFTAMSILALLLTSLLDIHLFNIFPTIIYSTMLCIFERYTLFREEKKKVLLKTPNDVI